MQNQSKNNKNARRNYSMIKRFTRVIGGILLSVMLSCQVSADTMYLPDVTPAMSKPEYWVAKDKNPDLTLVEKDEIKKVNQDIIQGKGTGVWDMSTWSQDTFNGIDRAQQLKKAAMEDADYTYNSLGARYKDGVKLDYDTAMKELYGPMIENCVDPDAQESMPVGYAICTNRTVLRSFPTDQPLPDDPSDPDFDTLYLSAVTLGEPLIARGKSADGNYYHVNTSYLSGWIPTEDIAFCTDRAEWLSAWNYDSDKALVVYDDKITTEESNYAPETSRRKLFMSTRLQIADRSAWEGRINNRYAYNNYVVWMPVRKEDGSFENKLALISEHCKVSEGFLPLTTRNLAKVIFNQLGNAYGWGGMLSSQDCSGYVRDVYRCFGLELGRNTTNQAVQPVRKYNLEGKTDQEKTQIIKSLPLGAELLFTGHAMMYLGCEGDKLYVISSVSNLMVDGVKTRVRGMVINTLDIKRANGNSWIKSLHTATIPYYLEKARDISGATATIDPMMSYVYDGKEKCPKPEVKLDGKVLQEGVHYTLSYEDNVEAGRGKVNIQGMGNYEGSICLNFQIKPDGSAASMELENETLVYNGKKQTPLVTVRIGEKKLESSDYTLEYKGDRKNVGTHTVTARLKGRYEGTAQASYKIVPKGTEITRLNKGKSSFVVKWKIQKARMSNKRITGYQVMYATNKKFTTGKETATVKKYRSLRKKVKELRSRKKYYVRVRTFMKVDGKRYYSPWSKIRSVKTR